MDTILLIFFLFLAMNIEVSGKGDEKSVTKTGMFSQISMSSTVPLFHAPPKISHPLYLYYARVNTVGIVVNSFDCRKDLGKSVS